MILGSALRLSSRRAQHQQHVSRNRMERAVALLVPGLLLALTGCGLGTIHSGAPTNSVPAGIKGAVHGGQQPVGGALVQLMAPGIGGYGTGSTVLATTTTSLVGGTFTLPSYTCPTPDRLVYLEATGGSSGTGVNPAIDEVALLGNCSTLSSSDTVIISELTTVAAAYALAPFATVSASGVEVGTSSTNLTGLNNAYFPANNLIPYSSISATGTTALPGMVLPTQLLNTLGNILSACVNTALPDTTNCTTLFTNTKVGSVTPTTTFQAAVNIALHPGANVANLYALPSSTPPFQPAMTSLTAPPDFSLAIGYNGSGISTYGAIDVAIDATGNAWISDFNTTAKGAGLIEITPSGQYPGGAAGFGTDILTATVGIGIDPQGLIWINNTNASALTAFHPDGSFYAQFNNVINPNGQAIDGSGNIWTSAGGNADDTYQELVNNGDGTYTLAPTLTAAAHFGTGICITPTNVFETAAGAPNESSAVTVYNEGTQTQTSFLPDYGAGALTGCSVDHAGNLYLPEFGNPNYGQVDGVEIVNATGTVLNTFPFPGPNALAQYFTPQEMAVDGLGNSWAASFVYDSNTGGATPVPGTVIEFDSSGNVLSPTYGYAPTTGATSTTESNGFLGLTSVVITGPGGVAVDGSGNLWLAGTNHTSPAGPGLPNYVTEVLGIAAPLVTPKSTAIKNNQIGVRP